MQRTILTLANLQRVRCEMWRKEDDTIKCHIIASRYLSLDYELHCNILHVLQFSSFRMPFCTTRMNHAHLSAANSAAYCGFHIITASISIKCMLQGIHRQCTTRTTLVHACIREQFNITKPLERDTLKPGVSLAVCTKPRL